MKKNDENILKCMELCYNPKKDTYLKNNMDKNPSIKIGNINILQTEEKDFKIEVTLENEEDFGAKTQEFIIPDLYRVHKVIEWIILNLHYNE